MQSMDTEDGNKMVDDFNAWLKAGLASGEIPYNQAHAMVHFVPEGMLLVVPAIFKSYAGEEGWIAVQKKFSKSEWAIKAKKGKSIWSYQVVSEKYSPCIILHGVVVGLTERFLDPAPSVNPILSLIDSRLSSFGKKRARHRAFRKPSAETKDFQLCVQLDPSLFLEANQLNLCMEFGKGFQPVVRLQLRRC